ncbi:MAG: helix-turn-helix domain-containing protein, partial [Gemmatimonadetes bacterium]|nr:helix-turn-helix domain-containing protein [Gemmatimonadota bacterium]
MADMLPDDYPARIVALREQLGLTQAELADQVGVAFATVNRWENARTRPSRKHWEELLRLEEQGVNGAAAETEAAAPDLLIEQSSLDFAARPAAVRAVIEGERLAAGYTASPAFATEIARVEPLPHQRIAVYERMLKAPRLRFLLADDPGAGKTIMTGLYVREMLARRLLRRVLVVPPAGLVGNWRREMSDLFALDFQIVSGDHMRRGNPFAGPGSDLVIGSVDTLNGPRALEWLRDPETAPYDLVVFDEAHKLT